MAEIRQKVDLDVSESISGLERLAALAGKLDNTLQGLGDAQKGAFSGANRAQQDFNRGLTDGVKNYQKIEVEQKQMKALLDQLTKSQKQFISEAKYKELQKEIAGVKGQIQGLGGSLDTVGKQQKKVTSEGGGMFQKFGGMIAGAFAVGAVLNWAKQIGTAILNVTAEFQKFEAVLTTSLGSGSAAERAMMMIQDFAAKTPFSVQELTDAYVKLAGRGIRATSKEMEALGDLAASTGKSFDQLTEAVLDAMSGENERLKEFGVLAKRTGDTTQYTFKGVTTEVKNTDEAIKEYLISLGQVEGVTGSMANISETLTGQLSNLGDSLDQLFLTIGNQETGAMSAFTSWLSSSLNFLIDIVSTTDQLGAKMASEGIATFAEDIEGRLRTIATTAKANGEDVSVALTEQTAKLRQNLSTQLAEAQKAVEDFGHVTFFNRDEAAQLKARVALIKGELAAIADAERFVIDDLNKAANKAQSEADIAAAKAREEAEKKRLKALQDLYKELENLEKQAAKARLDMLNKNSEAYLRAVLDAELEQIAALEASIREKQRLAGVSTDLTPEQLSQINALSLAANKRYYDALTKMQNEERDKLLELQKDSDAKELAQLENKYDDQIRAAREASKEQVAIALEAEKERAKALLIRQQAERTIDKDQEFSTAYAENVMPDSMTRIQAEELLQERLLEIQIEFAKKRLALVADSLDKEDRIRAMQLDNEINRLNNQLEDLQTSRSKFSLQKLLGLDDEQMDAVRFAIGETLGQLQSFLAETVAMREKEVQGLTRAIDEKGRELDREILLNEQGFASNVETKQQEYDILKQQREQALRDQQKAQRAQIALDTAMQASNLITASTEIYAVMAPLGPVGIAGAIALIATMFGTFLAAKARALQSTTVPSFGKGGGFEIKGAKHSQGGVGLYDNVTGKEIAQYEGNEYLYAVNSKATAKHLKLLEAINGDNQKAIVRYALDDLLLGTGVMMNPELPEKLQSLQAETKTAQVRPGQAKLPAEIIKHLGTIAKNTAPTPERIETPEFTILRSGNRTRNIRK